MKLCERVFFFIVRGEEDEEEEEDDDEISRRLGAAFGMQQTVPWIVVFVKAESSLLIL